jgi:hypothetical protein
LEGLLFQSGQIGFLCQLLQNFQLIEAKASIRQIQKGGAEQTVTTGHVLQP